MPGPLVGTLPSPSKTIGPRRRNALLAWLLPLCVIVGGLVIGAILAALLGSIAIFLLFELVSLAGAAWYALLGIQMAIELKSVTQNPEFAWWPFLIPFYNMYWAWILVPQEIARAKQKLAIQQPPRSIVLYIFLWHFALASDLNDMVR